MMRAKLTAAALGTSYSVWTADGKAVVFKRYNVPFWAAADGSGQAGPLPSGIVNDYPWLERARANTGTT
jgi:hypothetical protein